MIIINITYIKTIIKFIIYNKEKIINRKDVIIHRSKYYIYIIKTKELIIIKRERKRRNNKQNISRNDTIEKRVLYT